MTAARLRAFELMERAQGDRHADALDELVALELTPRPRAGPRSALLAGIGQALYRVVHDEDRPAVQRTLVALVVRAESLGSPSLVAMALSLRAVGAGALGDSEALLTDAGRAVALAEDDTLPALDRCTVLVICGAAYNSLSLWELTQELYDEAVALTPLCDATRCRTQPWRSTAPHPRRVGDRAVRAGRRSEALLQIGYAAGAVETALATPDVPPLWQLDARACGDVLALVQRRLRHGGQRPDPTADALLAQVGEDRVALAAADDIEVLPLLDALVALSLHRLGRRDEAVEQSRRLSAPGSSSTGARSFPGWVRAHVLTPTDPDEAVRRTCPTGC